LENAVFFMPNLVKWTLGDSGKMCKNIYWILVETGRDEYLEFDNYIIFIFLPYVLKCNYEADKE